MSEIPKIVRQRLQQADDASVPHPDANVLTAFAESSLLPAERTAVLDHLSYCAECREVLAFALPAMEAGQAVLPVPRRSRLSWPILRWAFVSAGIVALSVFGFVEYGHRDDSLKMAKNSPPPAAIHADQSVAAPAVRDEMEANEERSQTTAAVHATREKDRHEPPQETELAKDLALLLFTDLWPTARGKPINFSSRMPIPFKFPLGRRTPRKQSRSFDRRLQPEAPEPVRWLRFNPSLPSWMCNRG